MSFAAGASSRARTGSAPAPRREHALVTGAAGAIGAALCEAFRARSPALALTLVDRDEAGARRVAERLGGDCHVAPWDLADPAALPARVEELVRSRGEIDLLVSSAGVMDVGSFARTSWQRASTTLRVNLESPLLLMSLLVPAMVARRRGLVVNVTSMAGVTPLRGCSYYGASKAGLAMASEIAHLELAPLGVAVVTVYPGPVRSALERRARTGLRATRLARWAPTGEATELAEKVVRACVEGRARVAYPALYELASRLPGIAARLTRALSPPATDA